MEIDSNKPDFITLKPHKQGMSGLIEIVYPPTIFQPFNWATTFTTVYH